LRSTHSSTTVILNSVGGLPEPKLVEGKNYGDWKFWMKTCQTTPVCSAVFRRVSQEIEAELDLRALAKLILRLKPCAVKVTKKCQTAKAAWEAL
jgi:hypothetical protein